MYAVRVCSCIYFFLCAIWSGAWPILNARRLTLWNVRQICQIVRQFSPNVCQLCQNVRQMSPNVRQMFAKCSPIVRQMFAKCRKMFVKIRQMFAKCLQHFARFLLFVDRFRLKFKNSFGREMGRRRSILRGTAAVLHRISARCFLEGSRGLENSTVFRGPCPGPGSHMGQGSQGPMQGAQIQFFGAKGPKGTCKGPKNESQIYKYD